MEADRLRKRDLEAEYFLMGRYVFDAVSLALANGFRKKGTQPQNWLEDPYRLVPYTEQEKAEIAERDRQKAIAFFKSMMPSKPQREVKDNNG